MARLATLTPEQQLLGALDLNTGVISYTSQPPTATAGSVTTFEPEISLPPRAIRARRSRK